ncbi:MAG: hypothetical protein JXR76_19300 [Deltaproteobacteria bacterium]|nr:hypothetical protein [Deltaproteobacteria bacterium]
MMTPHSAVTLRFLQHIIFIIIAVGVSYRGECNAGEAPVTLKLKNCDVMTADEVSRILRLEIKSSVTTLEIPSRKTQVTIRCAPESVEVTVNDLETSQTSRRKIDLEGASKDGDERVLAIAATELVISIWEKFARGETEDESATEPNAVDSYLENPVISKKTDEPSKARRISNGGKSTRTRKVNPPRPRPQRTSSFETDTEKRPSSALQKNMAQRRVALRTSGLFRFFPSTRTLMFGGELGAKILLFGPFELQVAAAAHGGRERRRSGTATLFSATALVTMGLNRRIISPKLFGRIQLGARGGWGRLDGSPQSDATRGHIVTGAIGGPFLRASLGSATFPSVGVSLESGYSLLGISGNVDGDTDVALAGFWGAVLLDLII